MVGTLIISGGTFYLGWQAQRSRRSSWPPQWWRTINACFRKEPSLAQQLRESLGYKDVSLYGTPCAHRRNLVAASAALGISATGVLLSPPLQLAALPTLIWMGIPAAQRSYDNLFLAPTSWLAFVETAALAVVLVKGTLLVGSLGFTGYHLGRWWSSPAADIQQQLFDVPLRVMRHNCEQQLRLNELRTGDQIAITAGQAVPLPGTITAGDRLGVNSMEYKGSRSTNSFSRRVPATEHACIGWGNLG